MKFLLNRELVYCGMELTEEHKLILNLLSKKMDWVELGDPREVPSEISDLFLVNDNGLILCRQLEIYGYIKYEEDNRFIGGANAKISKKGMDYFLEPLPNETDNQHKQYPKSIPPKTPKTKFSFLDKFSANDMAFVGMVVTIAIAIITYLFS